MTLSNKEHKWMHKTILNIWQKFIFLHFTEKLAKQMELGLIHITQALNVVSSDSNSTKITII